MTDTSTDTSSAAVLTAEGVFQGVWRLFPVSIFVIPFGIAFGAAAIDSGLTAGQAIAMSAFVFAGASQFAVLDMWATPLPYISMMLVVLAVNARHVILGAVLSPWINRLSRGKRFMSLMMLSDANFADTYGKLKNGSADVGILLGGGLTLWTTWMIGTVLGAVMGNAIGPLENFGIDVVMPAFFTALVVGELKSKQAVPPLIVSIIVAIATLGVLPVGWNIIAAAVCGGITGVLFHGR